MTDILKSNDNFRASNIELPYAPDKKEARSEMEIYARFMRHLRMVPNSKVEIKILSAIQFTADMLDISDALIAKTLVDLGLRAPRASFPSEYLDFVDKSLLRSGWEIGGPTESAAALKLHWDKIGEDKFAAYRREPVYIEPPMFVET
ncbi:MAG: hypothetical protein R3D88_06100 [Alphaproteobacteria bacterium]|nr:hypothetical protein [Alphaproteobacteria bacterium]